MADPNLGVLTTIKGSSFPQPYHNPCFPMFTRIAQRCQLWHVVIYIIYVLHLQEAAAIPPPDNSSTNNVPLKQSVEANMSDVDDIGMVMVWNGSGAHTVASCEWTSGGSHGHTNATLDKHLTVGKNYIIFALYNKIYQAKFIFIGGKWSYSFSLLKAGVPVWNKSDTLMDNKPGLKYWKVIVAEVSPSGEVTLSDELAPNEQTLLETGMAELEAKLNQGAGFATPF